MIGAGASIDDSLEALFQASGAEERLAVLDAGGLLNAEGLSGLLDRAMAYARDDPARARLLASTCAEAAGRAGVPAIVPRATYARAQTHAINGEFDLALNLIDAARREYEALGERTAAIRTNLGKIHVLNELGRHQEAVETGEATLRAVEGQAADDPQTGMIAALACLNLGVCYETLGRYEKALDSYDQAEARFISLGLEDRLADVRNNRGIVLAHLGKAREALQAFEDALTVWQAEGLALLEAQTLSNIGEAHLALGDFTRSLNAYERARDLFESLEAAAEHSILLRKTGDAYLALNLYPEAAATYRRAVDRMEESGMADQRGRALLGLGAALNGQDLPLEAVDCLEQAVELFRRAGNDPMLATVLLELSAVRDGLGEVNRARAAAAEALERVDPGARPVEYLFANLRLADLYRSDPVAAELHLAAAGQVSERLNLPAIRYRLNSRLGRLRRIQGRSREAEDLLRSAAGDIEQLRGRLAHEAVRTSFLADKTAVYDDLIALAVARGGEAEAWAAFEFSEQAKSRTLADLVAGTVSAKTGGGGMRGRLRSLQAERDALYNRIFSTEAAPPESPADLGRRAAELEQEISRLRLQAAGRQAAGSREAAPAPVELRRELGGGAVLVYHLVGDELLAFWIDGEAIRVVRGFAQADQIAGLLGRLDVQWERFKAGEAFARRNLEPMLRSAERILEELYQACFAPAADLFPDAGPGRPARVAIVPHGLLHQVPFHALFDGARYLADRFEICYAPSASVLAMGARLPRTPARRALVAGLADGLIPLVEREAQAVALQLGDAGIEVDLLTGPAASLSGVQVGAAQSDLVHLACHGLFRSDNPLFSALKLADGWLTGADVMELELPGSLVVLSACESGKSRVIQGEEVIGLPRAFLGAGAASVLVSTWLVQDEAAAAFMEHWYRELAAAGDRASALRRAQLALRETHPHPFHWAPFVLVGQR